jgi:hypothetical protein
MLTPPPHTHTPSLLLWQLLRDAQRPCPLCRQEVVWESVEETLWTAPAGAFDVLPHTSTPAKAAGITALAGMGQLGLLPSQMELPIQMMTSSDSPAALAAAPTAAAAVDTDSDAEYENTVPAASPAEALSPAPPASGASSEAPVEQVAAPAGSEEQVAAPAGSEAPVCSTEGPQPATAG